jgi:hypothetical protein
MNNKMFTKMKEMQIQFLNSLFTAEIKINLIKTHLSLLIKKMLFQELILGMIYINKTIIHMKEFNLCN